MTIRVTTGHSRPGLTMDMRIIVLVLLLGYERTGASTPGCDMTAAMACSTAAINAYTVSTRGEAVAAQGLNTDDAKTVGTVLGTSITTAGLDLNVTCFVIERVEYDNYTSCVLAATSGCVTATPTEADMPDVMPSFRVFGTSGISLGTTFCNSDCKDTIVAQIAVLNACWVADKEAVRAASDYLNATTEQCRTFEDYLQCHIKNSTGCAYLNAVTTYYVSTLNATLDYCNITVTSPSSDADLTTTEEPVSTTELLQATTPPSSTTGLRPADVVIYAILLLLSTSVTRQLSASSIN